jgi:lysophospholipase L1-like esterase
MHDMFRFTQLVCLLCLALPASHAAQTPPVSMEPVFVITGASYAADWKTPPLPGYDVINRGRNGDVTQQMLARFDAEVLAAKPQLVLIWGHINNHHRAGDEPFSTVKQRIQADYREMVARARRQGAAVVLATEVTLSKQAGFGNGVARLLGSLRGKEGYRERINRQVRELNVWLRTFATAENLPLLDFERVFDDGNGYRRGDYTSEDGSHISAAGYLALSRELAARRQLWQ